ncbi:MAG: protein adenylyltransferase SelO family protein [Gammaproteobacteria bacterium]|nr:protein adenylyltransferase SelO family protein [Gammaproteobacteria bacterium]
MVWSTFHYDNSYSRMPAHFYARVMPELVPAPYLIHLNLDVAKLTGVGLTSIELQELLPVLSGNALESQYLPLSMLYAGHQLGHWVPQLGDGRAIQIAEIIDADKQRWALQLKGAGPTPYSRNADGRAVLRSTIREYLCSEAMQGLGIPTTRALSMVGSDMEIYREEIESAAILLRTAPSFVRFRHFEVFASRGLSEDVQRLADYIIAQHYPDLKNLANPYAALFTQVVDSIARLMAQWQASGFMHGVMNTDNMSIHGITIDYGPFAFMDG